MSVHPQKMVLRTDSIQSNDTIHRPIEKDFSFAHMAASSRVEVVQETVFRVLFAMAYVTACYGLINVT